MLRAVSSIYVESQVLAIARRDVFKLFRHAACASISTKQTVLSESSPKTAQVIKPQPTPPPPPPPPPGSQPPRAGWVAATAVALTASVGGVYFFRKLNTAEEQLLLTEKKVETTQELEPPIPASPESLPRHVDFLVIGAGTAAFAALRALRSVRPEATVLLVGDERALPYMRPPLTKELWREPDLAKRTADPDTLIFQQWNGRKRRLSYEPASFYTPTEKLRDGDPGAGIARGWSVSSLDVEKHEATLAAPGLAATLTYRKCLIATGARSGRAPALRSAREAGLALSVRSIRDVTRLADKLQQLDRGDVVLLGGGAHACELAAGLAHALRDSGKTVVQVFKEETPLADQLPQYLAADVGRRLQQLGVRLLPNTEVTDSGVNSGRVHLQLTRVKAEDRGQNGRLIGEVKAEGDSTLEATLVVECVGTEPNTELAKAAGLELHPEDGGIVVNAEMQARTDVFAAGDVASFHEPLLGRRRVLRHDHAVASGRLAGANMAAVERAQPYTHQPMLWTDIGPDIGLEAIGIIDAQLPTVSVFSEDAVTEVTSTTQGQTQMAQSAVAASEDASRDMVGSEAGSESSAQRSASGTGPGSGRRYERGVVLYVREQRVVGVLLWNLFNRMHVARQVLKQGEFEDLFEVAKLFALHEDD